MRITDGDCRGERLTRHLRGCGDVAMTTDEIMALTRRVTAHHGAHLGRLQPPPPPHP